MNVCSFNNMKYIVYLVANYSQNKLAEVWKKNLIYSLLHASIQRKMVVQVFVTKSTILVLIFWQFFVL